MRELRDLVNTWLDRIPARTERWQPDPDAVRVDRRQQELLRELAELDVYVDTVRISGEDDGRRDRRAL